MRSSKGTSGLREARGEGTSGLREARGESVSGTEREARGGERREGDVLGLGKRLLGCREQREKGDEGLSWRGRRDEGW
ncbi:hypothetical protein OIU76_004956 [Salix suchowensis]|nr:hypothetical protein OIU78_014817 [Salix suchowensis]KAJ6343121.1 hypothetical protein OIU76_004956 [Salix suchowensis]